MLTLKDLERKHFPMLPDIQLNTYTGTMLISLEICPVGVTWPKYYSDLFKLIADEHDNYIQRTRSSKQCGTFCKVKPYIPAPSNTISTKRDRDSDIWQHSVDPPHIALSVPHLVAPIQTVPQQNTIVQSALKNKRSSSKTVLSTSLNLRLLPSASNMA